MPPKFAHQLAEQQILKKFEELGWKYKYADYGYGLYKLILYKPTKECIYQIDIYLKEKTYYFDFGLDMQEHQLLHELFKCWEWINE